MGEPNGLTSPEEYAKQVLTRKRDQERIWEETLDALPGMLTPEQKQRLLEKLQ